MPVGIVKANLNNIDEKISEVLSLIGYKPRRDKIFIKPNVANIRKPRTGVITHPRVVEALLKYFSNYDVVIGEGSIIGAHAKEVFEKTGYTSLAKRYGVQLMDLNDVERVEVKWKYGVIRIPKILETHEYINIPTMKTHMVTKVTLGMKNQKGLLSPSDKMKFHKLGLHQPIRQFARVVKPDLTLVDGIICVEGDGPGLSGRAKKMSLIIAGTDMIEVDNVCCRIMGFDANEIEHIPPVEIGEIKGFTIDEVRRPFLRARSFHKKFNVYYHPFDGCSGCINSVGEGVRSLRSPIKLAKFLYWGLLRRLDFIAGSNPALPKDAGRVICVGNCAAKFAREHGLTLVEGCPPNPHDIGKVI
jgi:uncharacterized protein (DUF362 family)